MSEFMKTPEGAWQNTGLLEYMSPWEDTKLELHQDPPYLELPGDR